MINTEGVHAGRGGGCSNPVGARQGAKNALDAKKHNTLWRRELAVEFIKYSIFTTLFAEYLVVIVY